MITDAQLAEMEGSGSADQRALVAYVRQLQSDCAQLGAALQALSDAHKATYIAHTIALYLGADQVTQLSGSLRAHPVQTGNFAPASGEPANTKIAYDALPHGD